MAYCGPRGIPYLHFMGGPDEWDSLSRDLALMWAQRERDRCPECGTPSEDWAPDGFGYHVDTYRCLGCERLQAVGIPKTEGRGMRKRMMPGPKHECPRCMADG